jgi:membrane peptidoglycan carboxypeptidase
MIKKAILTLALLLTSTIVYYSIVIIIARTETRDIVQKALTSDRMKLELMDFSSEQLEALLKVEDPNFYHHKGFDISTPGAGVTTISQGLVKMYYFENFKPGIQKIKQTLIARFAFDILTPKDTILKLFVNEVYLGQNGRQAINGFENAANFHYHKPFEELSWDEYLSLLAMILAPSTYDYTKQREANADRVLKIKRMLAGEYTPTENSDLLYNRR